jgi:hypothetical protein
LKRVPSDEPDTVVEDRSGDFRRSTAEIDHVDIVRAEFECEIGTERENPLARIDLGVLLERDCDIDIALSVCLFPSQRTEDVPDRDEVCGDDGANCLLDFSVVQVGHQSSQRCLAY